jgi:hypothetical protein
LVGELTPFRCLKLTEAARTLRQFSALTVFQIVFGRHTFRGCGLRLKPKPCRPRRHRPKISSPASRNLEQQSLGPELPRSSVRNFIGALFPQPRRQGPRGIGPRAFGPQVLRSRDPLAQRSRGPKVRWPEVCSTAVQKVPVPV